LKQEWQKSPTLGPGKQTAKLGLVWRNRKKISQIIFILFFFEFLIVYIKVYIATPPPPPHLQIHCLTVTPHRVHTEWQWPLSGVHSTMMEKLAQPG
jgi:hypothetical protein